MFNNWQDCKHILCIRPDNMGDLLMTGPALRALKTSFGAKITVLTSSMAAGIARFMPEIDEVITCDLPWVKTESPVDVSIFEQTVALLKQKQFDAAVIFTVYSQNPLPTVILAYLAGIPRRLAYCRENPYLLLTEWVPDKEPYSIIKHQVRRDLDLVGSVGASTEDESLNLKIATDAKERVISKLQQKSINTDKPWLILHPGVSEVKRQYPKKNWVDTGHSLVNELGYQLLITGSTGEKQLTEDLQKAIGKGSYAMGGLFTLEEFIALIEMAVAVVSVNTGTVHIAAASGTPCVVLYAQTNPQHTPWKAPNCVLPFSVPQNLQSNNEVIRFVHEQLYKEFVPIPDSEQVLKAVKTLLQTNLAYR
ncbi:glycosyltransferase family 9 protein [Mucilaginibacter sp. RCC_168]|uniref:glycosyltransferase family 9 protein n=1 Tax=Mucilaginibacter sp. RCC_168 TaxID=3239221 RepID=UPI00352684A5